MPVKTPNIMAVGSSKNKAEETGYVTHLKMQRVCNNEQAVSKLP